MHLMDIMRHRTMPGTAVFLGLTRRCPLTCRHCCTNSLMSSEEHDPGIFLGFVDSFTPEDHPEIVLMSGGEALLRPRLVRDIARRAATAGTRSYVMSGMFFARSGRIPGPIQEAIDEVDHFAASLDIFHEEEVSRSAVLTVLRRLVDSGKDVSLQLVGMNDDDPYLAEATAEVREVLDDRVPMLVGIVGRTGRAAEWMPERRELTHLPMVATPEPCGVAAWPIVAYDGTVIACCNQHVVDQGRAAPAHLRLGHASSDGWPVIRERTLTSATLRAVRTFGPRVIAQESGTPAAADYCKSCYGLSAAEPAKRASELVESPTFPVLELGVQRLQDEAGPVAFARRNGSSRYAELVTLGHHVREQQWAG